MAYKALYRTYRPQTFSEVVGQETIVKTLQNSIKNNKISHAYMFCGPRGTGKTTIARIFAKTLNCTNQENMEPCNECLSCNEITEGTSPDVIEIDAASNNGVDEIRELKEKVKFLPAGAKYKVYIIDEVHMLSTSAFNALLKTLEEPPSHAIFILATTEPHKVLPTIVSRCQRFDFKALTAKEIVINLKHVCEEENVDYDANALQIIAKASDGGMRDALSFLDQTISLSDEKITDAVAASVTGAIDKENLVLLANNLENKLITESLQIVNDLQNSGREIEKIINGMLEFYRDVLMYKATAKTNYDEDFKDFANKIDIRKIYFNIEVLNDVQAKIKFTTTPQIYLEVAIIKMINASSEELDYGKRILELESKIDNVGEGSLQEGIDPNELKRIRLLEEKFNNLLTELSKLELPKLSEKVKNLENNTSPNNQPINTKEFNLRLDKAIEDIELLKVVQNSLRNEVENISAGGLDEDVLSEKVEENVKKYKPSINYTEIEGFVKKQLNEFKEHDNITNDSSVDNNTIIQIETKLKELEEKVRANVIINANNEENISNEIIEKIEKEIDEIRNNLRTDLHLEDRIKALENNEDNESQVEFDNSQNEESIRNLKSSISKLEEKLSDILLSQNQKVETVKDSSNNSDDLIKRIDKIESNVYKIMSGMLAPQTQSKKSKSKIDDKQISLWRDDIIDVEKISEPIDNIKADFGDLSLEKENKKEPIVEKEIEESEAIVKDNELVSDVNKGLFEENIDQFLDDSTNKVNQEENEQTSIEIEENLFDQNNFSPDNYTEDIIRQEALEDERLKAEKLRQEQIEKEQKQIEIEKKEQAEKERIAMEEKIRQEQIEKERIALEEKKRQEQFEKDRLIQEQKRREQELEIKRQEEERASGGTDLDEYERYDVKVLERIMNDARNPEFMTDKERITNLWKHLISLAPVDKRGVAEILTEGQITAVGNHEFVLIYNNSSTCNQVMNRHFKRNSLKLLFDLLDGDYNYFAITQEVWMVKRKEYSDQYSVGTKYPTLSPINDPSLRIVIDEEENDSDGMLKKVYDIFGPNINVKNRS